jgi:glycosyltransferase involved in cell wall biosynthesis
LIPSEHPAVTVVIPALNEARVIGDCLRALAAQTYPAERLAVVVVDNGSVDDTAEVARQHGASVLHVPQRSAYVARNAAIRQTQGDYLAFTDADCVPDPRWIEELLAAEARERTGVVAGHIEYRMSFDSLGNRMLIASRTRDVIREHVCVHHCAPTGNVLIRRALLETFGPFCETAFGSDIAMSKTLAAQGHPPAFAPLAAVVHQCDLTNGEYLSRTFWNNRGNALHDPRAASAGRLLRELCEFPWRPGLRRVPGVQLAAPDRPRSGFFATWLYSWISRFAAYTGRLAGTISRITRGDRRPTPGVPSTIQVGEVADRTVSAEVP